MTLLLVLFLALTVALYAGFTRWSRRQRKALGLEGATVVTADDSRLGGVTLRSVRHGLVGRPDHVLRVGNTLIPVEQKPSARRLQPPHVMQVAAQCLLVEEVYGMRPPYGLVVLAGGIRAPVAFTPSLERRLLATMAEMRGLPSEGDCTRSALGRPKVPGVRIPQ